MQYKITYPYNIRFFKPNEIPVSTLMYDPKWYHNNTNNKLVSFVDSRGIYNGLRAEFLASSHSDGSCPCNDKHPEKCDFLKKYENYIKSLDFEDSLRKLEDLIKPIQALNADVAIDTIVLIVNELPNNKCSERSVLQKWFESHNARLEEYAALKPMQVLHFGFPRKKR